MLGMISRGTMIEILSQLLKKPVTEDFNLLQSEFEEIGLVLKQEIASVFKRSLAIRQVDCGNDNAALIEIAALSSPYYDIERFGISFVASPRHADVLMITGTVTHNMAFSLQKTYHATPSPKFVMAIGDDACNGGCLQNSYAIAGPVSAFVPVDVEVPGNPPEPLTIMRALCLLMKSAHS